MTKLLTAGATPSSSLPPPPNLGHTTPPCLGRSTMANVCLSSANIIHAYNTITGKSCASVASRSAIGGGASRLATRTPSTPSFNYTLQPVRLQPVQLRRAGGVMDRPQLLNHVCADTAGAFHLPSEMDRQTLPATSIHRTVSPRFHRLQASLTHSRHAGEME